MLDKRIIFIVFIAVSISAAISLSLNDNSKDFIKQVFVYKVWAEKKYDLIIAGDSRIYRGISTKPFEDKLSLDAINLGFSSALFEKHMFKLVDEKLNFESEKKTLVLGITPHSLTKYSWPNGHIRGIKEYKTEDVIHYMYLLEFNSYFTPINIIEQRNKFKAGIKESNYIQEPHMKEGWVASDYRIRKPYSAIESYNTTFQERKLDPELIEAFLKQISKWVEQGIDVYGFLPPSSFNIESLERSYSGFNDKEIIKQFIEAGGKWINLNQHFESYDGSHLIKESAIELSKNIAKCIQMNDFDTILEVDENYRYSYFPKKEMKFVMPYDSVYKRILNIELVDGEAIKIPKDKKYFNIHVLNTNELVKRRIDQVVVKLKVQNNQFLGDQYLEWTIFRGSEKLHYQSLNLSMILNEGLVGEVMFHLDIPDDLKANDKIRLNLYNKGNEIQLSEIELFYF